MNEWIPVEEDLPEVPCFEIGEKAVPVLITYLSYHDKVTPYCDGLAVWDGEDWLWWNGDDDTFSDMTKVIVEVTHWMPLPEPARRE